MFIYYSIKEFFYTLFTKLKKPTSISWVSIKRNDLKMLKKSFSIRVIDAWDDEWTFAELYALESPEYSTEQYWIHIVASPKHADAILVVWAISDNMKQSILDTYDVVPSPKVVIACWDKAINWDKRFYWAKTALKDILKVDLEIPGNPPRAIDILSYIWEFLNKI